MSEMKTNSLVKRLQSLKKLGFRQSDLLPIPETGLSLKLRLLTAIEEAGVFKYASQWEMGSVEYLYGLRLASLSHAISYLKFDDGTVFDLAAVSFVETGETSPEGAPVMLPTSDFVRSILETWNNNILERLYRKFSDMIEDAQIRVDSSIKIEVPAVRRTQEMARILAKVNNLTVEAIQDKEQPNKDIENIVNMLAASLRVATLAALARDISIETRYDFSPKKDRNWTETPEADVTPADYKKIVPEGQAVQPPPQEDENDLPPEELQLRREMEEEAALAPAPIPKR